MVVENITFDRTVSTPTSKLTTFKIHWNIILSIPGSKYLVVDVKKIHLNNPMYKHEYYNIALRLIPPDIIDKYNIMDNQINNFLYVRV